MKGMTNKKPKCLAHVMPLLLLLVPVMYSPSPKRITYENTLNCRRLSSYEFFFLHSLTYCPILLPFQLLLLIWCMWHKRLSINHRRHQVYRYKVNCNRIQATSTEHQHQYWHRNKPIPAITPWLASERMNKKAGNNKTTFNMGIKRQTHCEWENPASLFNESQKSAEEKHEGGIFIVFCHIIANTHIATVRQFFAPLTYTFARSLGWLLIFLGRKCGKHIPIICLLSSCSIFSFIFFRVCSSLQFGCEFCGKESKKGDKWKKNNRTLGVCVCVVESKYFKSIIVISVGAVFSLFVLFIFLSSFIFECYLKSVFYFSYDFLLNLRISSNDAAVRHTVAVHGDVDLSLIVSFRVFYSFFIEVIFSVVGFFLFVCRDDLWTFICRALRIHSPVAHFVWFYWNISEFRLKMDLPFCGQMTFPEISLNQILNFIIEGPAIPALFRFM